MCLLSFVTRYYVLKFGIGFFDLVGCLVVRFTIIDCILFYDA